MKKKPIEKMTNAELEERLQELEKPIRSEAAAALGSMGGKSGRGTAKRRSPEHYQRLAKIRAKNRKKRVKEQKTRKP